MEATEEPHALKESRDSVTPSVLELERERTRPPAAPPLHLGYDVMHVTPGVVGAVVVAEAVQDGLGFELVFVCD